MSLSPLSFIPPRPALVSGPAYALIHLIIRTINIVSLVRSFFASA